MITYKPRKVSQVPGCRDCPLYEDGNKNFVPDELREGAPVFILGQNPGELEDHQGKPFIGRTGQNLEKDFLPLTGLTRDQVSIGNAIRCRWQQTNKLPEIHSKLGREVVDFCSNAHLRVPSGTKVLLALGGYSLLALTGHGWGVGDKITSWRGWMLPMKERDGQVRVLDHIYTPRVGAGDTGGDHDVLPVLATVHVAAVDYDPKLRLPAKSDWQKVKRYLRGSWPETPPEIVREVDDALFDYEAAWDTEFVPETNTLLRFSAATGEGRVYCVENSPDLVKRLHREASGLHPLPGSLQVGLPLRLARGLWQPIDRRRGPVLRLFFQNAAADLPYLARIFPEGTTIVLEDEMLADSVLNGGFPHSLDYLSSLYSPINRHKHLSQTNEVVYSGMDAYTQYIIWRVIEKQLEADSRSEKVYREHVLPLVPIILEAEKAGVLIDQDEVETGIGYLESELEDSSNTADAAAGYKINLGSSLQVGRELYDVEKLRVKRGGNT